MRVTSITAGAGGITNNGPFKMTNGAGNLKIFTSDANGVGSWQPAQSAVDTNAMARLNGLGTNGSWNGLTVTTGGQTNWVPIILPELGTSTPSITFSNQSDSGIAFSSAVGIDAMVFRSAGNEIMRVNSAAAVFRTNVTFLTGPNHIQPNDVFFATSNRSSIGQATLPASNVFSGQLTLPTVSSVGVPVAGSVAIIQSNNTVYALKNSGALVDLESGGGVGDITGGNVNQFSESSGILTLISGLLVTNTTTRGLSNLSGPVRFASTIDSFIVDDDTIFNSTVDLNLGGTTFGSNPFTSHAPLVIDGSFNLSPITNATTVISQVTNVFVRHILTGNTTFTFGGTPLNGAQGKVELDNPFATNITVTWPLSYSVPQGVGVTTFTAWSNTITVVHWETVGGSNRVSVAAKEIVENFSNPTAGQQIIFHDPWTKTNAAISAASGDAAKVNETAISDSFSLTNTPATTNQAAVTWSVTAGTDPDPDKVSAVVGLASATQAGIISARRDDAGLQEFSGLKRWLAPQQILSGDGSVDAQLYITGTNGGEQAAILLDYLSDGVTPWKFLTDSTDDLVISDQNTPWLILVRATGDTKFRGTNYSRAVTTTNLVTVLGRTNDSGAIKLNDTNHVNGTTLSAGYINASNVTIRVPTNSASGNNTNISGVLLADGSVQLIWVSDNAGGGADATAIHDDQANEISAITAKATPVGNDLLVIEDSAASNVKKSISVASMMTALSITNVYDYLWVPAGAMNPAAVNGAATNAFTVSGADGTTLDVYDFDDTTPETNFFLWTPPENWDRSTFKAKFHWTATAGTAAQGVVWAIRAGAVSNDDPFGAVLGTGFQVTDAYIAASDLHISDATSAITAGGTPALGDTLLFQVERKPADVSDTKTGDAKLLGVMIQYRKTTLTSVAW